MGSWRRTSVGEQLAEAVGVAVGGGIVERGETVGVPGVQLEPRIAFEKTGHAVGVTAQRGQMERLWHAQRQQQVRIIITKTITNK